MPTPVDEIRKRVLLEWWHTEVEGKGRSQKTGRNDLDALSGVRTRPDHVRLEIRQYFNDWAKESPGEFHIERVSAGPAVPNPPTPAVMARRLDSAATWVERTIPAAGISYSDVERKRSSNALSARS